MPDDIKTMQTQKIIRFKKNIYCIQDKFADASPYAQFIVLDGIFDEKYLKEMYLKQQKYVKKKNFKQLLNT